MSPAALTKPPIRVKETKKITAAPDEPQLSASVEHRPDSSPTMQSRMMPFHDSPVTDRKRRSTAGPRVMKLLCRSRKVPDCATGWDVTGRDGTGWHGTGGEGGAIGCTCATEEKSVTPSTA